MKMKLQTVLQYFALAVCSVVLLYLWYDPNSLDSSRRLLAIEENNHHKSLFPLQQKEIYGTLFLVVALFIGKILATGCPSAVLEIFI